MQCHFLYLLSPEDMDLAVLMLVSPSLSLGLTKGACAVNAAGGIKSWRNDGYFFALLAAHPFHSASLSNPHGARSLGRGFRETKITVF